jgi:hypothetical protein
MKSVLFSMKPGNLEGDVEFRFTIRAARDLERTAGCNYQTLLARGQQVEAVVLLTCFGLRHADKTMTPEKATDLVDTYVEAGGNVVKLYEALQEAMNYSGVYGPAPAEGGEADPTRLPKAAAT